MCVRSSSHTLLLLLPQGYREKNPHMEGVERVEVEGASISSGVRSVWARCGGLEGSTDLPIPSRYLPDVIIPPGVRSSNRGLSVPSSFNF